MSGVGIVPPFSQVETAQPPDPHTRRDNRIFYSDNIFYILSEKSYRHDNKDFYDNIATPDPVEINWTGSCQELLHRYSVLYIQCTTTNTPDPVIRGS